jgi:hypothetical protein
VIDAEDGCVIEFLGDAMLAVLVLAQVSPDLATMAEDRGLRSPPRVSGRVCAIDR